jgi:MoaA/NifB/PqqE/SkfB family radical SAM enzyme
MTLKTVTQLVPGLRRLGTELVLLSGGEPLLNPEWAPIAEALSAAGFQVWLLTSGLSLAKHARRVAALFERIIVSLDGTDGPTYSAIRGLDAFDTVCNGIRAVADLGRPAGIRVTVQRSNYRQLPQFVRLAKELRASSISYLAADVANPHAFARTDGPIPDLALDAEDLPTLKELICHMEHDFRQDFADKFIAESPAKLLRLHDYFSAVRGLGAYPKVRCNAPEISAVIGASGRVQPCFFIAGPSDARIETTTEFGENALSGLLNRDNMRSLRTAIRTGARPECQTCVCSLWRDPTQSLRQVACA